MPKNIEKFESRIEEPQIDSEILKYFSVLAERELIKHRPERGKTWREPKESFILRQLQEGWMIDAFDYLGKKAREFKGKGDEKAISRLRELQQKFPMEKVRQERNQRKESEKEIEAERGKRKTGDKSVESYRGVSEAVRLTPEQQKMAHEEFDRLEKARGEAKKAYEEEEEK